ncbi:MAG: hypothetical protein UT11_C0017G0013 [Berkelbacteria bacterium GW2011_GWA2_38_9]|uniref:ParB/Sulfiredoxin domain-containing protein n=1 Tax=Berkelbacteria bacterium GW2011_GWA2_38_9 TaxID=1618334 RepID=A0A0G0LPI6_9BACT|nr:MAG: hypothetical protein UT11_C0017G0013 [Berkelbacteria bacterium GW2011_GWA2_38_9]
MPLPDILNIGFKIDEPKLWAVKLSVEEILVAELEHNLDIPNFPIEIYFHKDRWIILDGVHRFTKVIKLGHKTIKVRKVSDKIAQQTKR